jgi:hypothetical protein
MLLAVPPGIFNVSDLRPIAVQAGRFNLSAITEDAVMKTNQVETLQLREVGEQPTARAPSGRVIHDVRGNARWDWAVSTVVLAKKTVAELIHTLDVPAPTGEPYNRCGRRA